MEELIEKLKVQIIEAIDLPQIQPQDIDPDEQLVGGRLGIDSVDVLELVILMEKKYGIIDITGLGEHVFASLRSFAQFIKENAKELSN